MKTPAFGDDIIDVDVVVDVDAVLVVVVQRVKVPLLAAVGRAAASRWPTTTNDVDVDVGVIRLFHSPSTTFSLSQWLLLSHCIYL